MKKFIKLLMEEDGALLSILATTIITIGVILILSGCAVPSKKDAPHKYRVEVGKKCVNKADGTVAWSYVWIARDDVKLVRCK